MNKIPGENILQEILNGNDKVITKVYKNVYNHMENYGLSIGSTHNNVKEAVQNAFEVFYRQALTNNLVLTCAVETYIVSIAKNVFHSSEKEWLKHVDFNFNEQVDDSESDKKILEDKLYEEKSNMFWAEFKKIGKDCRKVLTMTLKEVSVKKITQTMGYSSEEYTRTKRKRCKKYLIDKIKENPEYEKLREANPEDIRLPIWGND